MKVKNKYSLYKDEFIKEYVLGKSKSVADFARQKWWIKASDPSNVNWAILANTIGWTNEAKDEVERINKETKERTMVELEKIDYNSIAIKKEEIIKGCTFGLKYFFKDLTDRYKAGERIYAWEARVMYDILNTELEQWQKVKPAGENEPITKIQLLQIIHNEIYKPMEDEIIRKSNENK